MRAKPKPWSKLFPTARPCSATRAHKDTKSGRRGLQSNEFVQYLIRLEKAEGKSLISFPRSTGMFHPDAWMRTAQAPIIIMA